MNIEQKTKEVVVSRTYTLDAHDVEVLDAFCDTILAHGQGAIRTMNAAKGLANMLKDSTKPCDQKPASPTYTVTIMEVKEQASIVFEKGRTWSHITYQQKNALMDILQPWCKYHIKEDK